MPSSTAEQHKLTTHQRFMYILRFIIHLLHSVGFHSWSHNQRNTDMSCVTFSKRVTVKKDNIIKENKDNLYRDWSSSSCSVCDTLHVYLVISISCFLSSYSPSATRPLLLPQWWYNRITLEVWGELEMKVDLISCPLTYTSSNQVTGGQGSASARVCACVRVCH